MPCWIQISHILPCWEDQFCQYLKNCNFEFGEKVVPWSMYPMPFYHDTQIYAFHRRKLYVHILCLGYHAMLATKNAILTSLRWSILSIFEIWYSDGQFSHYLIYCKFKFGKKVVPWSMFPMCCYHGTQIYASPRPNQ